MWLQRWIVTLLAAAVVFEAGCADNSHRDAVAGGAVGCAAGVAICLATKRNPAVCAALCAAGVAVGASIGAYFDNRREQIERAARAAAVPVSITKVAVVPGPPRYTPPGRGPPASPPPPPPAASKPDQNGLLAELNVAEMFPSGSAQPTPDAATRLGIIAQAYATRTDKSGKPVDTKILITGHTDASGPAAGNQILSVARARSVARFFELHGIPPGDLYLRGAGSSEPIANNDTPQGRASNRRVEVLEIDNEQNLVSYAKARRADQHHLAYSTVRHDDPLQPPKPAPPNPTPPRSPNPGPDTSTAATDYGFGGRDASPREDDVLLAVGPVASHLQWRLISESRAAEPIPACYLDKPRVDGDVVRYTDSSSVESHPIGNFLPGMYGAGWGGSIGTATVGFAPVAVLRDEARPVGNPTVYVQRSKQTSAARYVSRLNTYEGEHSVLYRVYLEDPGAPISCFDIAMPKSGQFTSAAGWAFYMKNGHWTQAEFHPALIREKS